MGSLLQMLKTIPGIIIAFSFHEWGHAYAAYKMGDPTARNLGRMTLNPLAHIDPIGFLMMVVAGFGWAKPVPVNPNNYRNYRAGELVVSLAGVTVNLILAIIGTVVLVIVSKYNGIGFRVSGSAIGYTYAVGTSGSALTAMTMLISFATFNLALMVFNLIPVFPLDGFHVAEVTLSKVLGPAPFRFLRNYGQYILIGILLLGRFGLSFVGTVSGGIFSALLRLVLMLFGMPAEQL